MKTRRIFLLLTGLTIFAAPPLPLAAAGPQSHADEFETRRYLIPPSFPGPPPPDPFSDPTSAPGPKRLSAREVLEGYGIAFPQGATAHYNQATSALTIRHHRKGFEAIEKVLEGLTMSSDKQINLRIEIYELPKAIALELQEAKAAEPDHREQLKNVRDLVARETARLVTSSEVIARSGQRSEAKSTRTGKALTGYEWNEEAKLMLPQFEEIQTGTTFQVDPVLGADDQTVDLNFSLELRSEDPMPRLTQVVFPDEEEPREIAFPVIHTAKMITQITTRVGKAVFVGVFKAQPNGEKNADDDDRWVAFLMADLQTLGRDSLEYELISGNDEEE